MPFLGTIPAPMRAIVAEHVSSWGVDELFVPCSGLYTIQRVMHGIVPAMRLHGNDVTLFSSAIGRWLAGDPVDVTVDPDSPIVDLVAPYMADQAESAVAALILAAEFVGSIGKDNIYHRRVVRSYLAEWKQMHRTTLDKLREMTLRLSSFYAGDALEWLLGLPQDIAVASFPPFDAGGYEAMWKALEGHFVWVPPDYPVMGEPEYMQLLNEIARRKHWIIGALHEWPEQADRRVGYVKVTNRARPFHVYASSARTRIVMPAQQLEPVKVPRQGPGDALEGPLRLHPLTPGQFNTLRSQYLNANIAPGAAMLPVAVTAGGRLVGCFAFDRPKYDPMCCYLMSDFAVAPAQQKHLAKLVLCAMLSTEAQRLIQRTMSRRLTHVSTTAFSRHPTSQKYRGLLKITSRKESDDPAFNWQLNYAGELGRWDLAEGLATWQKKWGQER
jgi:hypothetical protein